MAVVVSDHKVTKVRKVIKGQLVVHKAHKGRLVQADHKVVQVLWGCRAYKVIKVHKDFKVNKDIKD